MLKKVSLKDIAKRVGVSTALVSYVLNNKKEGRIGREVADKIRNAAAELKYRPNQLAKSLKMNKTFTIGLIVSNISNPFSSNLARIIEDEADRHNYTVIFGSSDENKLKSWKLLNALADRRVDGFIIAPAENSQDQLLFLQENEIPFVLIDRYFPDLKTNYVVLDNFKAAFSAVKHLAESGNSKIGMINYETSLFHLQERTHGYLSALIDLGISENKKRIGYIHFEKEPEMISTVIDTLVSGEDPVDSILFASNTLAIHGLKYLQSRNIRIPEKVSIMTFDELETSDLFYAPLSYMKQPLQEMGRAATKLLLESIEKNSLVTEIRMEAELVIRKSTMRNRSPY